MRIGLLFALCISFLGAIAQESDCSNALFEANKLYENGKFQDAVNRLENCVKTGAISREEKLGAVRLLSISYLMLQNGDQAEKYAQELLSIRPDYKKYPFADPREFTVLLSNFKVIPKLFVGVHGGIDQFGVRVIKTYSTASTNAVFSGKLGYGAGIDLEYALNDRFSIATNPSVVSMRYAVELENIAGARKDFSEIIAALEVPLNVTGYFELADRTLFISCGAHVLSVLNAFANVESTDLESGGVLQSSTESTRYRTKTIPGLQAALGTEFPFGRGSISAALTVKTNLNNFVIPESRYDNSAFILSSNYIDSDFSLQSVGVRVGYKMPVHFSVVREKKK